MASYSGNYGKVSLGSSEVAKVESRWVNLRSRDWAGSLEVASEYTQALFDAFNSNSSVTLTLYPGERNREEPYYMGDAVIHSLGATSIQFQGTGPLYRVKNGEQQML